MSTGRQTDDDLLARLQRAVAKGEWTWLEPLGRKQLRNLVRVLAGDPTILPSLKVRSVPGRRQKNPALRFPALKPIVTARHVEQMKLALPSRCVPAACQEVETAVPEWLGF